MPQPKVSIIGAGLAGLVLGRCLLKRGIPAVLYERDANKPRHGYGITLRSSSYRQLLSIIGLDEKTFIRRLAVDGAVGGSGKDSSTSSNTSSSSFRANRLRFEELLQEGLDIRWEHKLQAINGDTSPDNDKLMTLSFENSTTTASTSLLIGADGPHSQVRKLISPSTDFTILPFAVYNGKRRLNPAIFEEKYASHFQDTTVLSHESKSSPALLQISINDRTEDKASLSYIYSRPAQSSSGKDEDALFRPSRPIKGATDMPPQLFEEIDAVRQHLPEGPFREIFDSDAMKEDRLLNWLMRSVLPPQEDLDAAAGKGIVLLGDAVHHGPILGSEGANEAIEDAVDLAEVIASGEQLGAYYGRKYSAWSQGVREGEARLAEMHGGSAKSSL